MTEKPDKKQKPGPKEDRLKIEGDWEDAVGEAIKKPRPPEGWPKEQPDSDEES